MQFLIIAVLLAQSSQVPVLSYNVALDFGEDLPSQDGAQVFPVLKVQGGQVRIVAHPHSYITS